MIPTEFGCPWCHACSEHCWRRSEEYTLARLEIEVAQVNYPLAKD